MQQTLKASVEFSGVGLHSGVTTVMRVHPASANYGIWFKRTDAVKGDPFVPAIWHAVELAPLCTRLLNDDGVCVQTVEHVMSALAGSGIHNALIEISGPEVPILDGSAYPFAKAFLEAGTVTLDEPVRAIRVLKEVSFEEGAARATLSPSDGSMMSFAIDFPDQAIGAQTKTLNMQNGTFLRELCDSRTFCRWSDVETMRAAGLIKGGSIENALVVDGTKILTPGGARRDDEAVRHKMLDALGDLALAGGLIFGHYHGVRAGHGVTNQVLRQLFASPDNYEFIDVNQESIQKLPGMSVSLRELPYVA